MQSPECQDDKRVKAYGFWGTEQPRQRYLCGACGAVFVDGIIGRLPGHHFKGERLLRLLWAFEQGWSTRAAGRYARCSTVTAFKIADLVQRGQRCRCGEDASHNGWCAWRFANSPKRQEAFARYAPLGRVVGIKRPYAPRPNRRPRASLPVVWPFILTEPSTEHVLLLAINHAVPKGIPEQIRQDICQDVAVEIVGGKKLSAELIAIVIKAGQKKYRCRWDEISLASPCGPASFQTWNDVLSEDHPKEHYRPLSEPRGRSYQPPIKPEQFDPPAPKRTHRPQHELRGENAHAAKLRADQVVALRHMYRSGRHSQSQLGKLFGISQSAVFFILTGGTWRDVPGPIYLPQKDINFWARLGLEPPLLNERKHKTFTTQGHLEYRRAPEALCDAPQSIAHKGSQDSPGTFSSPTRYRREGAWHHWPDSR